MFNRWTQGRHTNLYVLSVGGLLAAAGWVLAEPLSSGYALQIEAVTTEQSQVARELADALRIRHALEDGLWQKQDSLEQARRQWSQQAESLQHELDASLAQHASLTEELAQLEADNTRLETTRTDLRRQLSVRYLALASAAQALGVAWTAEDLQTQVQEIADLYEKVIIHLGESQQITLSHGAIETADQRQLHVVQIRVGSVVVYAVTERGRQVYVAASEEGPWQLVANPTQAAAVGRSLSALAHDAPAIWKVLPLPTQKPARKGVTP